jgi:hypothetical protein
MGDLMAMPVTRATPVGNDPHGEGTSDAYAIEIPLGATIEDVVARLWACREAMPLGAVVADGSVAGDTITLVFGQQ